MRDRPSREQHPVTELADRARTEIPRHAGCSATSHLAIAPHNSGSSGGRSTPALDSADVVAASPLSPLVLASGSADTAEAAGLTDLVDGRLPAPAVLASGSGGRFIPAADSAGVSAASRPPSPPMLASAMASATVRGLVPQNRAASASSTPMRAVAAERSRTELSGEALSLANVLAAPLPLPRPNARWPAAACMAPTAAECGQSESGVLRVGRGHAVVARLSRRRAVLRCGFGKFCLGIYGAGAGVRPKQIQTDVISTRIAADV